jgi:WS/DGAT/MGAT family acyltransferase
MSDQLSPVETIMWRAGQDPNLRMTVGTLLVLSGVPGQDDLAERLAVLAAQTPRLRRRPEDSHRAWTVPVWVEDPHFDVRDHVRVLSVGPDGDRRQLLDLLALLEATPFDPSGSPWDATLVDGLEDGRAALYLRAHHVVTDGIGSVSLLSSLLDGGPPAAPPRPDPGGTPRQGGVTGRLGMAWAAGAVRDAAAALNSDPVDAVVRHLQRAVDTVGSVCRQMVVPGPSLSSLPSTRSMTSRFDVMSVPKARTAAVGLGGSRNDLLVAAAALGLGAYHRRLGLPAGEFRVATPTSRHRDARAAGNSFAPMRITVPGSMRHPATHFGIVADRLARARQEPAVAVAGPVAAGVSLLPAHLLLTALRSQAVTVDFAATAFPGLRGRRAVCGAEVEESYPFGPRLGRPMNISGAGHGDRLDIGISLDQSSIEAPDVLLECLGDAFEALAHERNGGRESSVE